MLKESHNFEGEASESFNENEDLDNMPLVEKTTEGNESSHLEIIAITDTHNDAEAIKKNLQMHGVVDGDGEWLKQDRKLQIIHTGDMLNRDNPEYVSVDYMLYLKNTAPDGCSVHICAGNHEIDILRQSDKPESDKEGMKELANLEVLARSGPALFMHGYPTRELLDTLNEFDDIDKAIDALNEQYAIAASQAIEGDMEAINEFSYEKISPNTGEKNLFRNIKPNKYYGKHGNEVAGMLDKLGIDIVVHGHKPQKSGIQNADEFADVIPGKQFIANDVVLSRVKRNKQTKKKRIGSTKLEIEENIEGDDIVNIDFLNKKTRKMKKSSKDELKEAA